MNLLGQSIWRDEGFTFYMARQSLSKIILGTTHDTTPPLYYLILHFWMKLFGTSEAAMRSLSLVTFFLLGIAVFFFVREVFKSNKAGVFASLLILLNPFIFSYAFEARMYMQLMLLSVLSMWFFITRRWILYVVTTIAMLYTHNFGNFVFLIQIIYYTFDSLVKTFSAKKFNLISTIKSQIKSPFVISAVIIILSFSLWVPVLYNQTFKVGGDFWIPKPDILKLGSIYSIFAKGFDKFLELRIALILSAILFILRGFKKNRDIIFYLWLFLIPVIVFLISQLSHSIFLERYLAVCAPVIPILLATQKEKDAITSYLLKRKIGVGFFSKIQVSSLLLILVIAIFAHADYFRFNHPQKEPIRELSGYLKENYPNEPVINYYNDRLHYFELNYYGVHNKIYSNIRVPFWNGTAIIPKNDILYQAPSENHFIVMASENIDDIKIPGFHEVSRKNFNDLYIFRYEKDNE